MPINPEISNFCCSRVCIVAVWAACGHVGATAQVASFTPLGGLSGGSATSSAYAVSADSESIVGAAATATGVEVPVVWRDGVIEQLEVLSGFNGGFALDVSDDGSVVVGQVNTDGVSTLGRACRWESGIATVYGTLPGASNASYANGVSGDGRIIAGYSYGVPNTQNATKGLRIEDDVLTELFDIPGGVDEDSACCAVNRDGSVIGGRGVSPSAGPARYEACLWSPGPIAVALGDLDGGAFRSGVSNVNAEGNIAVGVGRSSAVSPGEIGEAARWIENGPAEALGDLAGGAYSSYAYAVSDDGGVIVGNGTTEFGQEAFVWTPSSGMERLEDAVLQRWGVLIPSGWRLNKALDLSRDGTTVVGYGSNPAGVREAWMMRVPCWQSESVTALSGDQSVHATGEAVFMVDSFGGSNPQYQWQILNGVGGWDDLKEGPVEGIGQAMGPTTSLLTMIELIPGATAEFRVVVSNPCGSEVSKSRTLTVSSKCLADLSEPFGTLDFSDVIAFLTAFGTMDPVADSAEPFGVFDFSDVVAFLVSFGAGCP